MSLPPGEESGVKADYPAGLVEWAGHRSGGVRKPFYESSGRPCKVVIDTPLLLRLREWAREVAASPSAPRTVLLVGGPGNGKTEAVEDVLRSIDSALKLGAKLNEEFTSHFSGGSGKWIPRLVSAPVGDAGANIGVESICVVQDASVSDPDRPKASPAELLVRDLALFGNKDSKSVYIACVNRGVLDDALTFAAENKHPGVQRLLETVIRSVGLSPAAPVCWPLQGFEHVAVWPMDVETLILKKQDAVGPSPAEQLLLKATDAARWPAPNSCAAGDHCPFCRSRVNLAKDGLVKRLPMSIGSF